jgi:hypothetical protein
MTWARRPYARAMLRLVRTPLGRWASPADFCSSRSTASELGPRRACLLRGLPAIAFEQLLTLPHPLGGRVLPALLLGPQFVAAFQLLQCLRETAFPLECPAQVAVGLRRLGPELDCSPVGALRAPLVP